MLTTDDIPSIRAGWLAEKRPGPRTLTGEEFGLVIDAVVAGLTEVERLRARVAELEVVLRAAIAVCDAHKDKSMWEYHGSIDALTDACSPMRDVPSAPVAHCEEPK